MFLWFFKVITFMINRNSLINYHQMLNDLFEEELMQNEKIRAIIFLPLRKIYTLACTYLALLTGLVLASFMFPYIFIIRNLSFPLTTNYTLPLSRGFGHFWIVPDNFLYHFHLLFETSSATLSCITAGSVDCNFGFYVYQFASTMHAMTFRLMNPLSTEKFSDLLRTCVAKHQRLLRCRHTLEHIYGPIVFWHIITNAILLCALMYDAMTVRYINILHTLMQKSIFYFITLKTLCYVFAVAK